MWFLQQWHAMKRRWSCFEKPKFLEDCYGACKRHLIEKMTTTGATATTTTTREATFCKRQQLANLLIHFCQSYGMFALRYQLRCLLKENKTHTHPILKTLSWGPFLKMLISFPFKPRTALIKVKDLCSFLHRNCLFVQQNYFNMFRDMKV